MAENKNQISTQEWSERMRSAGRQATTPPASISRAPVNTSGTLAQIRQNLTALNNQKYGLALANIKGQYNLADKMASLTQNINANAIARKEQLYANRQANLDRMAQMYGQYYQQFGNVLNKEALDFLDKHSDIKVPTLTAIMAGYEHARASRAEQALAALDRTAKMAEAEAQLAEKQTALENEKAANDQFANLQKLDAQSKANQAVYDAQKAYLDEQARNEMLGAGLASTGRGTGVRALPGFGGGVGAGARAGVGRVPSAVTGARSGETVAGGVSTGARAPIARVTRTPDGQTVARDENGNVLGPVVADQNGQPVVVNDNGQTVGNVDANGNVFAAEQGLYAQYKAAGGGGLWQDPVESVVGYGVVPLAVSGGAAFLGQNARLGYVDPNIRNAVGTYREGQALLGDARDRLLRAQTRLGFLDNQISQNPLSYNAREYANAESALQRARQEYGSVQQVVRGSRNEALRTLGGRTGLAAAESSIATANNAGRVARTTGGALRLLGRAGGAQLLARAGSRFVPYAGWGMLAADALRFGPSLAGAAVAGLGQAGRNILGDLTGTRQEEIAAALAEGRPIPVQRSALQAAGEGWDWGGRFLGNFGYMGGFANPEDVRNFEEFYEQRTGSTLDQDTRVKFDKQNPVTRTVIMDGLLSGEINGIDNVHKFIDDTINTYSNPQEQQAIQQQIQDEKDQDVYARSLGTTGDSKPIQAVTEEMVKHFRDVLKTDVNYEDVALAANEYLNVVSDAESRNRSGAVGANTSKGRAESLYQIMPGTLQEWKMSFLKDLGHTLSDEQKELLKNAKTANDLDNDIGRPILAAMVLRNIYKNVAVRNQKFDKRGTNIRSDQMFLDLVKMKKLAVENGQEGIDPVRYGDYLTTWAVNHVRGTNPEAVRQGMVNGNTLMDEKFGPRRNAQGGNDAWWNADFNGFDRYANLLGLNVPQTQQAGYSFDVAPGVDVDRMNNLMVYRVNALNDLMAPTGVKVRMNSGYRDYGKQDELYRNRGSNPNPVGKPGWSKHQTGTVADLNDPDLEKAFNANEQLVHQYGTYDNALKSIGLQRGITDKNGKRTDLVHYSMIEDDEYHDTIDHDRLMASRGNWGKEPGNYWMRGVGSAPRQMQPAWDVSPQYMVENFGYPTVQYLATDYDPNLIFAGNQNGYIFDYDYDEDGNQIPY